MLRFGDLLQKHFPHQWQTIIAIAYTRLVYQSPLKDVETLWDKSYLSEFYKEVTLSKDSLAEVLKEVGMDRESVIAYSKEFHKANDTIIFDGTDYLTWSGKTDLLSRKSKTGRH